MKLIGAPPPTETNLPCLIDHPVGLPKLFDNVEFLSTYLRTEAGMFHILRFQDILEAVKASEWAITTVPENLQDVFNVVTVGTLSATWNLIKKEFLEGEMEDLIAEIDLASLLKKLDLKAFVTPHKQTIIDMLTPIDLTDTLDGFEDCGPVISMIETDSIKLSGQSYDVLYNRLKKGTFAEMHAYCESRGMALPVPQNRAENLAFLNLFRRRKWLNRPYLGLTDETKEGTWVNVNTLEEATYFNWSPREPNNLNNEDHVELFTNGKWNDIAGNNIRNALCVSDLTSFKSVDFDMHGTRWRLHWQTLSPGSYSFVHKYCKSKKMTIPSIHSEHEDTAIFEALNGQEWDINPFIAVKGTHSLRNWKDANTNKLQKYFNWDVDKPKLKSGWYYGSLDLKKSKWTRISAREKRQPLCLGLIGAPPTTTTPLVTTTMAPGDREFTAGGKKFKVHYNVRKRGNFAQIVAYCNTKGMTVPAPASKEENDKILEIMIGQKWRGNPYLAVTDDADEGSWLNYYTDEAHKFFNWDKLSENDEKKNFAELTLEGTWNHDDGRGHQYAVCIDSMSDNIQSEVTMEGHKWQLHLRKNAAYDFNGVKAYCKTMGMEMIHFRTKGESDGVSAEIKARKWNVAPLIGMDGSGRIPNVAWTNRITNRKQDFFNWGKDEPKFVTGNTRHHAVLALDGMWRVPQVPKGQAVKRRPVCWKKGEAVSTNTEISVGARKLVIHHNPKVKGSFDTIYNYCETKGMQLPVIQSKAENDAFMSQVFKSQ